MISIRKAIKSDAPFLAQVMLMASRSHLTYGLWDHFVGGSEKDCLAFLRTIAATNTPHLFQYGVFIIAEEEGQPVGGLSGYDPSINGMEAFAQALPEIFTELSWSQEVQQAAFDRNKPFWSCMAEEAPETWIVESVATMPSVRRRGVISLLLREVLAAGKLKGFTKAQISVLLGNTPARKAYDKAGFRYADEKRSADFMATYGDEGIARLIMEFV